MQRLLITNISILISTKGNGMDTMGTDIDDVESAVIDLDDADTMALIDGMRNAKPSGEIKRKIDNYKVYLKERKWRIVYNRRWRAEHVEHRREYERQYRSRPEVKARARARKKEKYHSDAEYREKVLARNRARRAAWSPEKKAEENRKQAERARSRRAKKRAEKAKLEAKRKKAREHARGVKAAWTPEQREEHKRKQREYQREWRAQKAEKAE